MRLNNRCPSDSYHEECPDDTLCFACGEKFWDGETVEWDSLDDPREQGYCSLDCQEGKGLIRSLTDLADHLSAWYTETDDEQRVEKAIQRRIYKETEAGIGSAIVKDNDGRTAGFGVQGYCEGSHAELPQRDLTFPFTTKAFERVVVLAEEDSEKEWSRSHGCEKCWPEGIMTDDGEWYAPGEVGGPIMPDCKGCNGEGTVL
jgi:hypothetical protein